MKLLLDTQTYLWWLMDDKQLSDEAKTEISKPHTVVFISAATIWEIAVSIKSGKIKIPDCYADVETEQFVPLPISFDHAKAVGSISGLDSSPLERMIVAQAKCDQLTLVTKNQKLAKQGVKILPA